MCAKKDMYVFTISIHHFFDFNQNLKLLTNFTITQYQISWRSVQLFSRHFRHKDMHSYVAVPHSVDVPKNKSQWKQQAQPSSHPSHSWLSQCHLNWTWLPDMIHCHIQAKQHCLTHPLLTLGRFLASNTHSLLIICLQVLKSHDKTEHL
jgi:hypothetical protein